MKKSSFLLLATGFLFLACQPSRESNNVNSRSSTPSPSIVAKISPSPSEPYATSSDMKEAQYNGYPYSHKREGDITVAMFVKRFLPRDDAIVVGASRDVIRRAYNEDTHGAPYLVDTATTRAIRVDGAKNGYVVLPVKEDTGEIHSLTITRVAR